MQMGCRCWSLLVVLQLIALSACVGDTPPPTPLPTATTTALPNSTAVPSNSPLPARSGLIATPQTGSGQASDFAPLDWVRQHAIPLTITQLDAGVDDLRSLDPIIGDVRIVALGESTYGARTLTDIQQRIVKYAVLQKGFNIIAVDAPPSSESWDGMIGWRNPLNSGLMDWVIDHIRRQAQPPLHYVGIGLPAPWLTTRRIEAYCSS